MLTDKKNVKAIQQVKMFRFSVRGIDTLSLEIILANLFSLPSEKGFTLNGKNLFQFFPFRVNPL